MSTARASEGTGVFGDVRMRALDDLRACMYDADGQATLCEWQPADGPEVPLYCNLHDHLCVLEDLLAEGRWADGIVPLDDDEKERLYRYFALIAWALDQCADDVRTVLKAAEVDGMRNLTKPGSSLMGFINHVWKHRDDPLKPTDVAVHHALHHGPYFFADFSQEPSPGQDVMTLENYSSLGSIVPGGLLVPSLASLIEHLCAELQQLAQALSSEDAQHKVAHRWERRVGDES